MRSNKLLLALFPFALWAQIGGSFLSGDLVRGGSALTTPGLVPTVSALGTLGQSDVTLASGIFSRAGALGLSTSGANSITLAPGGTTMLTLTSTGGMTFYNPTAVSGVTGPFVIRAGAGQSTTEVLKVTANDGTTVWLSANGSGVSFLSTISDTSGRFAIAEGAGNSTISAYTSLTLDVYGAGASGVLKVVNGNIQIGSQLDVGVYRASAGVIEVNNGTAGTYRDLLSRSYIGTATAAATLANSQYTFHSPSDTEFVITKKGSDGTPRSVTLTLAP